MAILTADQVSRLNNDNDLAKEVSLGSKIFEAQGKCGIDIAEIGIYPLLALTYFVQADATGGVTILTAQFPLEVVDAFVVCTTANGSGTLTLRKATTAISSAITCAVQSVLARTASIAVAQYQLAVGDTLTVVANGAADRGKITVLFRKI